MEGRRHRTGSDSNEIPRPRRTGMVRDTQTGLVCGTDRACKSKQSLESAKPLAHRHIAHRLGIEIDSVEYFSVQPQKVYRADHAHRDFPGQQIHSLADAAAKPFLTSIAILGLRYTDSRGSVLSHEENAPLVRQTQQGRHFANAHIAAIADQRPH